ncbi:hypothetical protein BOTCAL_0179g00220 [Botryotinia calthae]|uniref:Uncharacterized protein n=1 Tax=Botryotinia calthae TaxID=38488 RepID=A0A4Y8D3A7_9HELO|nr:hypothetical protein BOTCAL_0179g00220 [Botryotinia calthae]
MGNKLHEGNGLKRSGLGYDRLLEATEEGEMVVCYNPPDELHWEDYNFDKSKSNPEEYHYYRYEMIFVTPRNDQETLEMAAATLPGVSREPWNKFHTRKEQERVRKEAEMKGFREFIKRCALRDGEYAFSKHTRFLKRAAKQAACLAKQNVTPANGHAQYVSPQVEDAQEEREEAGSESDGVIEER